jgi:hypothetical protein
MAEREHHDRSGSRPQRRDDRAGGRPASGGGRGPRARSATAPSQRTRRAEPTRFAAYTLLRSVAEGWLRQPRAARHPAAPPPRRPRCRLRHRAGLRHDPVAGLLRRRHRPGCRPADRADRSPGARRAAPRGPPAHGDARVDPRRGRPDRGPVQGRGGGRGGQLRERRHATDEREDPRTVAGGSGPRGWGSGRPRGAPQPPPVGGLRAAGRPARARASHRRDDRHRTRRRSWPPTTTRPASTSSPGPVCRTWTSSCPPRRPARAPCRPTA